MRNFRLLLLLLLLIGPVARAATFAKDSTRVIPANAPRLFQATYVGVPLIVGGVLEMEHNAKFRSLRESYIPSFVDHTDNYLQYAPAAVMYGLRAFGVKGRSSSAELSVADALSVAFLALSVNAVKYTVREERPDQSRMNSFPSGHTAMAFMTATMLSKEYGHISPWISVGAYSVASATGLMRMMNNRHWMSDVMAGAGFGILSAEFGYLLSDLIFKREPAELDVYDFWREYTIANLSFIGFTAGYQIPFGMSRLQEELGIYASTGATVGLEGAWFWTPHWGVGARANISSFYYSPREGENPLIDQFRFEMYQPGIYFSQPIYRHVAFGAKAMAGLNHYKSIHNEVFDIPESFGMNYTLGASLGLQVNAGLGFHLSADYNILPTLRGLSESHINTLGLSARFSYRL